MEDLIFYEPGTSNEILRLSGVTDSSRTVKDGGIVTHESIGGYTLTQRLYRKYVFSISVERITTTQLNNLDQALTQYNNQLRVTYNKHLFNLVNRDSQVKIITQDDTKYQGMNISDERYVDITLEIIPNSNI